MNRIIRAIVCLILAVALTAFATVFIFENEFADPATKNMSMTIAATGEKSGDATGNGVKVASIYIDGKALKLAELAKGADSWAMDGNSLVCTEAPASIDINMENVDEIEIDFAGQSDGGIAEVSVNGQTERIDLYRGEDAEIKWNHSIEGELAPMAHIPEIGFLTGCFFIGLMWLSRLRRRGLRAFIISGGVLVITAAWLALVFLGENDSLVNFSRAVYDTFFKTRIMLHAIVMLSMALWLPYLSKWRDVSGFARFINPLRVILWAVLFMTGAEFISNSGSILVLERPAMLLGLGLHIAFVLFIYAITGSLFVGAVGTSAVLTLLNAANYYTTLFRGTSLHPSDLNGAATAMKVVGGYNFSFEADMLVTILFTFAACAVMWPLVRNKKRHVALRFVFRTTALCCAVAMVVAVNMPSVQKDFKIDINNWRIKDQYSAEGLTLTFIDNIGTMFVSVPEGYSDLTVENIAAEYTADSVDSAQEKPNVIVVMSESFADLEEFEGLKLSEPAMPYFNSLKNKNNTLYGSLQVSILGGMTSKTEFEFLTGANGRYCTTGSPYSTIVTDKITALPHIMNELGYASIAYHPSYKRNWNRDIAYPKLGFSDFVASNKITHKDTLRGFVTDEEFNKEIFDIDEATQEPLFLFGITMQNHGGYEDAEYSGPIEILEPKGDYPKTTQYLNLIRESDKALKKLISHYEESEEPVVILFFGDHLPFVDDELINGLVAPYHTGSDKDSLVLYHTPYLIWANYDLNKDILPEDGSMISVSLLQSVLMDAAGLPKTGYQKFLSQVAAEYPVISSGCVLDRSGNCVDGDSIDLLKYYTYLQYSLINGRSSIFSY